MAVDKLKEGIDGFAKDQIKLEAMVHEITEGEPPARQTSSVPEVVVLSSSQRSPAYTCLKGSHVQDSHTVMKC